MSIYPAAAPARDRFVLDRRPPRAVRDPWAAPAMLIEDERTADGTIARTATVFLTGRECPWRCVMCDLWQQTTTDDTPAGAIAAQVAMACDAIARSRDSATVIKLYNAGSFFDPRAVPVGDYDGVASRVAGFDRVVVECHPALVGSGTRRFLEALARAAIQAGPALEVAMGLETVHPIALERLHKRMTRAAFERAAAALGEMGVSLRVFLLVSPPFIAADEQDVWLLRSVDAAVACGATAIALIPTRSGNGALDALADVDEFVPPRLEDLERSLNLAMTRISGKGVRVFADLWDLGRFSRCASCLEGRRARLHTINLEQADRPPVRCDRCGAH